MELTRRLRPIVLEVVPDFDRRLTLWADLLGSGVPELLDRGEARRAWARALDLVASAAGQIQP